MMIKMTREGLALDMQVTLTASRANAMKTPMYINMKTRIAMFYMINQSVERSRTAKICG